MPMISLPSAPTPPALGRPSSASLPGGYISSELAPFVAAGGRIVGQDPYSLSIVGQPASRLGGYYYLRGPGEQGNILAGMRARGINDYIASMLGQGYTQVSATRLARSEGGYTSYLDIDPLTGNVSTSSQAPRAVAPTNAVTRALQNIQSGAGVASGAAKVNLGARLFGPDYPGASTIAGVTAPTPTPKASAPAPFVRTPPSTYSYPQQAQVHYTDISGNIAKMTGGTSGGATGSGGGGGRTTVPAPNPVSNAINNALSAIGSIFGKR